MSFSADPAEQARILAEILRRSEFLASLDRATQRLASATDITQTTARMLAEHLGVDRCAYAEVLDQRVFAITGDHAIGVPSVVGNWDVASFGPGCEQAMREGVPFIVEDTATDPRIGPAFAPAYAATTIRAVICVPLHKQGVFTAAMAVHQKVPRAWTPEEVELTWTVVARCWEALERAAADRALADSRARLDYAVRLSGIGFWYCDLPFDELIWDPQVKSHFFLPLDARVTYDLFYERIHPDDRDRTRQAIDSSIAEHRAYDVIYRTVDPATGAIKHIRALGGTAYAADGTPARFDGVTVDVTAQRLVEERLALQDRRKDEFLATLAHELRNPLAPIRTGLELLRASPAQAPRALPMMTRQLEHLVRLVDDLLDISRVTLGKVALVKARVDLRSVLDSALETTRPLVEAARHTLSVQLPPDPIPLEVDPTRLSQIIANLVNNAAKYTPPGGSIAVSAAVLAGEVELRVRDTGIGLAPEHLERIFDMFAQVSGATIEPIERAHGGLGIGLTLVRTLLALHGGAVTATSPGPGHGSTFIVRLPLAAPLPVAASTSATPTLTAANPLKILVVDDNTDAAEMLAMLLELEGNHIRMAHTGSAALAAATELSPDLIFLDIGLPDMTGYEVATRLRANAALRQPMLVALTGWGGEEDRRKAQAAGFDQHLVKPIDAEKLSDVLASARG